MGASRVVNVARDKIETVMDDLGMTEGFDVGLEMSGNPTAVGDLLRTMNYGGRVAVLGIVPDAVPINWNDMIFKGLTLKGIYGREMFETWYKMTTMLQSGLNVAPIITHRFHVDDFADGFAAMRSGNAGKVILDWD